MSFKNNRLGKLDVQNLTKHVHLLTLFLPEQFLKRGADQDCILVLLLIHLLISKCDLLISEIQKKFPTIDQINFDDVVKSHRAEEWNFCIAMEVCNPHGLRHIAGIYHDLLTHERSLDFLLDLLQRDQLHDSLSLNALDKTISFYEHIYKSYLSQEKFSMPNYLRDLTCVVLSSSDALQTDIQRIQVVQKPSNDQTPFSVLVQHLVESNEHTRAYVDQINRLVAQEDDKNRSLNLDSNSISSIESSIRNLDRLTKTFHEICSGLTTKILLLSDANERVSTQDIENIAYQACDKIYKKEDSDPYESLRDSMHEIVSMLTTISDVLETGLYDSSLTEQNAKQSIYLIAEQFKTFINESDSIRGKLELKEEELLDLNKMLKLKHDELNSTTDERISLQCQLASPSVNDVNLISTVNEQDSGALRNTVRLLKDEIWHLKMNRSSVELVKLEQSTPATKINEIADIYKTSTLLLNTLAYDRQLAAEIQLLGGGTRGELNITQEQYRTIMREAIGCV
ncbi:unnamed protein product [Rotaria sp. Silwood2]|nr:unnamed protein product [Rotaria sp. Silwood2]